jgi:casein kinase II subunit beta
MQKGWIDSFLLTPAGRIFTRVDAAFLSSQFNYYDIKHNFPDIDAAQKALHRGPDKEITQAMLQSLYGALHARFLLTKSGMDQMLVKYTAQHFQTCPRVFCKNVQCLPYGVSEQTGRANVKMYCPHCGDIYNTQGPDFKRIDGAWFGPNWVHIFVQRNRDLVIPKEGHKVYIPRIFGFKIYHPDDPDDD